MRKICSLLNRIRTFRNWYDFLIPMPVPKTALLRNGARISLRDYRSSDFSILLEIAQKDCYHLNSFGAPKIIVDVGANIGIFSVLTALRYPNATIYAFEPEPENYALLLKNIALNGLEKNVIPINKAVASKKGTATFYLSENKNYGLHSLVYKTGRSIEVELTTLDNLGYIDILKLDCEGGEYDILSRPLDVGRIIMELHKGNREELLNRLGQQKHEGVFYDFKPLWV